ncbi:hypothetical protein EC988_003041 [Linderina pennispora]|nr:hypothetical protein EC988_003041 [Linderina pennispora]
MRISTHNVYALLAAVPMLVTADEGGTRTLVISLSAGSNGQLIPFVMPAPNERGEPVGPPTVTDAASSPSATDATSPAASTVDTIIVIDSASPPADSTVESGATTESGSVATSGAPADSSPATDAPPTEATDTAASDTPADTAVPADSSGAPANSDGDDSGSGSDSEDEGSATGDAESNSTSKKSAAAHVSPTDIHSILAVVASGVVIAYGWM